MAEYAGAANAAVAAVTAVNISTIAAVNLGKIMEAEETDLLLMLRMSEMNENSKKRKHWVRNWIREREDETQRNTIFKLQRQLATEDTAEFRVCMRMPPHIYGELLAMVEKNISKKDTNFRAAISADERLSITLRHLALGDCYASLSQQYRVGRCTVGRVIANTCEQIYLTLKDEYLKLPSTTADWLEVSDIFRRRWNFPRLLGAVDGKHVRIQAPYNTGSLFFNYKDYFSIVLLAIADGNYEFLYVDVGSEGRTSDGGLWRRTPFSRALSAGELPIPIERRMSNCAGVIPYMLVADDAFPLGPHVIKPYSHHNLEIKKQIFNYRLSRARRVVENAFGVMASRFRIYHQEILAFPKNAQHLVLATCVLHNMLRHKCGAGYIPRGSVDCEEEDGTFTRGEWRNIPAVAGIGSLQPSSARNQSQFAKEVRDNLANYFLTCHGAIPPQYHNAYA